jgi:hypothetical protein
VANPPSRLTGWVWGWHRSVVGLLVGLVVWVGALIDVSMAGPPSYGLPVASSSFLAVLWQVQAASVGLVFALAVFVFGLLPQSRSSVTYREFLGRSWTLPLVVFNIGSLLFTGLVLLGAGHQVPAAGRWYMDGSGNQQAFLASERHGTWRAATEVPGTGALNKGGSAAISSVSCVSAGRCAANGVLRGWQLEAASVRGRLDPPGHPARSRESGRSAPIRSPLIGWTEMC